MHFNVKPSYDPKFSPLRRFFDYTGDDKDAAEWWEDLFTVPCLYTDPDGLTVMSTSTAIWNFMKSFGESLTNSRLDCRVIAHKFHRLNDLTILDAQMLTTLLKSEDADDPEVFFEKMRYAAVIRFSADKWKITHFAYLGKTDNLQQQYSEGEKTWEIVL